MAVEVLLRKSVESLGRVGEVVRVRPGFARNYLLPQGIAVLPTKENLRLVEKDKVVEATLEAERAKARAELFLQLSPEFAGIHTIDWAGPEEDVILVDRSFTSMSFDSFYRVPSYGSWLRTAEGITREYRRVMAGEC